MNAEDLQKKANEIRLKVFKMLCNAGHAHFGAVLSELEILTALYFGEMNIYPDDPGSPRRDRFVLSKGHGGPGLYAVLATRGFFSVDKLMELDKDGGMLPKHVDRFKVPGIDICSGALGNGIAIAVGMATAAKLIDKSKIRVYTVLGDGECAEGIVWEAAMAGAKYKCDNLLAIIDKNGSQVDGFTDDVMPLGDLTAKWQAFGWNAIQLDGHNMQQLTEAFKKARVCKGKPTIIIANTIKGKGISFMENNLDWHAKSATCQEEEQGVAELMACMR